MKDKLKSNVPQIQVICDYLIKECEHDKNLAGRVMLENKTVDKMYQYIINAVRNKFANQVVNNGVMVKDEDVFNLAIHYFIEDDEDLKKEYPNNVSKVEVKTNTKTEKIVNSEPVEEHKVKTEKKVKHEKVDEHQISIFDLFEDNEADEDNDLDDDDEYIGDDE